LKEENIQSNLRYNDKDITILAEITLSQFKVIFKKVKRLKR